MSLSFVCLLHTHEDAPSLALHAGDAINIPANSFNTIPLKCSNALAKAVTKETA